VSDTTPETRPGEFLGNLSPGELPPVGDPPLPPISDPVYERQCAALRDLLIRQDRGEATPGETMEAIEKLFAPVDTDVTRRLQLERAKEALIATGYFTPEQVGDDIAPRITELHAKLTPEARCVCKHTRDEHVVQVLHGEPACTWSSCGCLQFLKESPGSLDGHTEGEWTPYRWSGGHAFWSPYPPTRTSHPGDWPKQTEPSRVDVLNDSVAVLKAAGILASIDNLLKIANWILEEEQ
jgi:hypothetical protein